MCFVFPLCLPASAAEQKTAMIGTLTEVSGSVEVMKRGAAQWVKASHGMKIGAGDQISSGIDGSAVLTFENTTTEVKPLTEFTVGRAMESDKEYYTEMFLQVGKLATRADKGSGKANKFTVTTPSAVAGIRGTMQEVGFDPAFGTENKVEDGVGYMAPVDIEKLPPAVQMCLGAGSASEQANAAAEKADGGGGERTPAGGAGEAVSAAAEGSEGAGTAGSVSDALDLWLEASFDNQVTGEEKSSGEDAAPEEGGAAPDEAPAEDVGTAQSPGGEDISEGLIDESVLAGEEIEVTDGQEASIQDATDIESIVTPAEILTQDATTDVLPAGTTDAEAEAAGQSTGVVDEPPSESAVETATSDETLTQLLLDDVIFTETTSSVDLFGDPPTHPTR